MAAAHSLHGLAPRLTLGPVGLDGEPDSDEHDARHPHHEHAGRVEEDRAEGGRHEADHAGEDGDHSSSRSARKPPTVFHRLFIALTVPAFRR